MKLFPASPLSTFTAPVLALGALVFATVFTFGPPTAQASVTGQNTCPVSSSNSLPWMGAAVGQEFTIPSLRNQANPEVEPATYPLTVLRPADTAAYPGRRPVVVFQHGLGGGRCGLWWAAQFLAGHGYVTTVHRSLPGDQTSTTEAYLSAVDANRSVISYLRGLQATDPVLGPMIDLDRLALSGHSMGSVTSSQLQGDPSLGVKAIVAFDTLRRYVQNDPGAAGICPVAPPVPSSQVTPRAPALSFAMDSPCESTPDVNPPDLKLSGPRWWSENGIPNMQLVMKGYAHSSFTDTTTAESKLDMAHWIKPWLDHWLLGEQDQDEVLLEKTVNGRPASDLLSDHFLSSACLPGLVDSEDFRTWLSSGISTSWRCGEPVPPPVYDNRQLVKKVKLEGPRGWVKAGGKLKLKLRITVADLGQPVRNLKLKLDSSNRWVKIEGPGKIERINPKATRIVTLKVRAKRAARGRARVRVTVAGRTVKQVLRVKR